MKKIWFLLYVACSGSILSAQPTSPLPDTAWEKNFRGASPKINDLVHTRLEVKFDFDKSWLYGKELLTLKPHYYPTDSLSLDAKGMDIHRIAMMKGENKTDLKFDYDGMVARVQLGRTFKNNENYTLYIEYTAKPDELKVKGSAAITDAKGLYFINPKGLQKDKPTEIWTQGETESNSAWFLTIDKPNQKCTEEIYMTVPDKYVTLSNGKMISQKKNGDGTRTDYWKMDLPHSPYLFFMGVGDYAIVKDSYKGKEVNYYVEKEYAQQARRIFGHTPEMMAFYSRITGIEYPWPKYDQIVGRDYVSGAMENTTCTLHQESAQQDDRELVDGNAWEDVIAHELFHHWFGDLVTTESWSNITLNESFADFSETLWNEYKYGKDAGDAVNQQGLQAYLSQPANAKKNLVRYYYADKEDVFDAVSYSKGGRILNMLRNYVGDSAFFKSLNTYLTANKFKNADAQSLRLAFEEVTGLDLNWYWNQWYYGSGHPQFNIDYLYDEEAKTVKVVITQTQDSSGQLFKIPLAIDIYNGAQKYRHRVWVENRTDTFTFAYNIRPDLVNVDGDKIVLCEKKDNKTLSNFVHQYKFAGLYMDRREAIDFCAQQQGDPQALDLLKLAMKDRFYGLRIYTLDKLDLKNDLVKKAVEPILSDLSQNDPKSTVRAKAIELLGTYNNQAYKPIFEKAVEDSSYAVAGNGLQALAALDMTEAITDAKKMVGSPVKGKLAASLDAVLIETKDMANFDLILHNFEKILDMQDKLDLLPGIAAFVIQVDDKDKFMSGVNAIIRFRNNFPGRQHDEIAGFINKNILEVMADIKEKGGFKDQADYIKKKIEDTQKDM